jgi:nucleotide-binding universal stress UspA family protein
MDVDVIVSLERDAEQRVRAEDGYAGGLTGAHTQTVAQDPRADIGSRVNGRCGFPRGSSRGHPDFAARDPSYGRGMNTLVIGYDGSPEARAALNHARERVNGGKLFIVTAAPAVPDLFGSPLYQNFIDAAHTNAQRLLDQAAAEMPPGVDFETELLEGPPAEAIVRVADARDADTIVIGSRGLGRVRSALGSVSHDVLHLTDRPVLIVPSSKDA